MENLWYGNQKFVILNEEMEDIMKIDQFLKD